MVLLILVECAFWFNPAVWLIHQRWAICRELDADDQALSYSTIEPKHFANLLLSVVSNQRQPWLQTAIGVTRDFKALKTRLLNMKSTPKTSFSSSLQAVATAVVVAAMFLLPWKITFASPTPSQSDNLVINGGFESALDSWHESTLPSGSETQVKFGIDSGEKHSGKASLKFEKKENRYFPIQQLVGSLRSKIAVTRRFETTAWIKANQAGKLTMKAVFMDSSGESIGGGFVTYVGETGGSGRVTHDWKKFRSVVDVPASTKSLTFSIEMYGPGEVWIDDVSANFVDDATALVDPFGKESSDTTDPLADIKDVPNVEFQAKKDPKKTYFLIGNKVPAPANGYKLLLVLPGGTGSKDFNPFVRRIWKNAELERQGFIIAQLAAPQWETSESRIVWPIRANSVGSAKFKTEEFVNDVIFDVKSKIKVDPEHIYAFGWSSGGPATYAALLDSPDIKGAFVAMSIFRKEDYPTLSLAKGRSLYLFQSPEDKVTNFTWAEKSKAAFTAAGVRTELVSYPGGHGFTSGQPFEDIKNGLEWLTKR